ncbi:MAG TPA: hypothetical protein VI977_05615 [archaeon]|nr:hypothetical protein [archaeon]
MDIIKFVLSIIGFFVGIGFVYFFMPFASATALFVAIIGIIVIALIIIFSIITNR